MEQEWAARERRHGVVAEELADRDAAGGNLGTEDLHRRQALAHQRAATIHEHAAELYRRRIARLESERPIPLAGRAR